MVKFGYLWCKLQVGALVIPCNQILFCFKAVMFTDRLTDPLQWNLSNPDTLGTEESVLISEVS